MGIGICLVYGFKSYSLWGLCEGLETGSRDLYLFWGKCDYRQCET